MSHAKGAKPRRMQRSLPFPLRASRVLPCELSVQGGDNISREEHEVAKDVFPPHNWNPSRLPRDFSVQGENNVSRETANERGNISDRTAKEGPRTLRRGRPAALVVARSRFELLSQGPEPCMIDRYTTGLFGSKMLFVGPN